MKWTRLKTGTWESESGLCIPLGSQWLSIVNRAGHLNRHHETLKDAKARCEMDFELGDKLPKLDDTWGEA